MFNFITVRILAWVIAAIFACAVVSTFVYYHKGLKVGEDKLELYKLTVKAVGEAQAIQTKRVIIEQQLIATEANDEATKLRDALDKHYADQRVRDKSAKRSSSGVVSTISCAAEEPGDTAAESELSTLRVKAANDALTILLLQKWAHDTAAAYNGSLR